MDADLIRELARRRTVSVCTDVLNATDPAVKFRELWRVLELAFQAHGKELVSLLDDFPPVERLDFDRDELEALRVLRGRPSHAASRLGPRDIAKSNAEALTKLDRLWCLVDWVVLTKKDASRSLDVDELRPLFAYVDKDRKIVFTDDPEEALRLSAVHSPRFRRT